MLKHTTGNLIYLAEKSAFDIIVQGCNCFCTMGSGIAKQIKDRYPSAYDVDCTTNAGDIMKLGNFTSTVVKSTISDHEFRIVNAYTQYNFNRGQDLKDVFEYVGFQLILQKLQFLYPNLRYGFPYIGMGLAGGNSEKIIGMIENFAEKIHNKNGSVTLVEYVPNVKDL